MANAKDLRQIEMNSEPTYRALFLGAGPQMQCGVGQFTRLLQQRIGRDESCASLTLTRSEGTLGEIWRAAGAAESVVCNFPIVAWKRVIFRPLLALLTAKLRRRKIVLIQHEWAGLHWVRRLTYIPALLLADTIVMFSPLVRRELADDSQTPGAKSCTHADLSLPFRGTCEQQTRHVEARDH